MNDLNKTLEFLRVIEKFKTIERYNKTSNLNRPESDAEHTWHLIMMAYLLAPFKKNLNKNKLIYLALIHDLVEVYAGDVNVWDESKISKSTKFEREKKAIDLLVQQLPEKEGLEIKNFWYEYEERKTEEARFIYALDKLQPFLQRLVAGDSGWTDRSITIKMIQAMKPKEVVDDKFLSDIWDEFVIEAKKRKLTYKE